MRKVLSLLDVANVKGNIDFLTVFLSRDIGDILRPAIIAIKLLKLPMLNDSRAVSIQNSIILALCFFFGCCKKENTYKLSSTALTYKQVFITLITSVATR